MGIEDPDLLNPNRQRSLENQIRLSGYRKSLERLMALQRKQSDRATLPDSAAIRSLRRQYSIAPQEEDWILSGLSENASSINKAEFLIAQLPELINCYRALNQPMLHEQQAVLTLLQSHIAHKKELIVRSLLEILETVQDVTIAKSLQQSSPSILMEILEREHWQSRLSPEIVQTLTQPGETPISCSLEFSAQEILHHLEALLQEQNPLIQAAAIYAIAWLDAERAAAIAQNLHHDSSHPLVQETTKLLLSVSTPHPPLTTFPTLEKLVYLFNSDFFHRVQSETLIALANLAEVRTYSSGETITEAGDTCRELLLLIEGNANILYQTETGIQVKHLHPGQTLDELEVLAHSTSENTIVADSQKTRIIAISVDTFDNLLDRDPDFARRVLELESKHLQRFVRSMQT